MTDLVSFSAAEGLKGVLGAGTRLGRYELLAVLGQGGFGITYRARDAMLDRQVAIKEYLPISLALRQGSSMVVPRATEHSANFRWGRERFLDEARTLAKLGDAPAIVRVLDFLEANGTAYMVMALAEGETLDRHLRRAGPLSPDAVSRLLPPLLEGLERVHAAGFVHRDIKPSNIVLDGEGAPTLVDFGASRVAIAGQTAAMTALFSPGYGAPEQYTSARQGPPTDIYGLSATLYHAIMGNPPPSAIDRMLADHYIPLSIVKPPGFPPCLLGAIDRGLAVRAVDRPKDIADWQLLLGETRWATRDIDEPTRLLPRVNAAVGRGRATRTAWTSAGFGTFLVATGAFYFWQSHWWEREGHPSAPAIQATADRGNAGSAERCYAVNVSDDLKIQACDGVISAGNAPAEAFYARGYALNNKGGFDRAIEDFDMAIRLKPGLAEPFNGRGFAFNAKGESERAIADLDQAIKYRPDFAEAFNNRGMAYNDEQKFDRAVDDFTQAIKLKPWLSEAWNNRGLSYLRQGHYDQAIADFDRAIELKPSAAALPFYNRAMAYSAKRDYDRAIQDFERSLRLKPDFELAINGRNAAYYAKRQ